MKEQTLEEAVKDFNDNLRQMKYKIETLNDNMKHALYKLQSLKGDGWMTTLMRMKKA